MEKIVLCDTNILIDFYNNVDRVVRELQIIQEENIAVSVVTASELVYGALNKRELRQILLDLNEVQILPLNEAIGKLQLELISTYSLSHNLTLPDALIAATAIHYDIPLFTLNIKDFRFIPAIKLYEPSWDE